MRSVVSLLERRDRLAELRLPAEVDRADAIPGQGAFARALADFLGADGGRHRDVRLHAAMLRALARHAVVLADRDRELTEARIRAERIAIERIEVLHRALAVGLLTDDDAATVVLNRGREDLRSRRAEAIDQHDQRAVPGDVRLRIVEHFDAAAGLAQLHDRAVRDEQTRTAPSLPSGGRRRCRADP